MSVSRSLKAVLVLILLLSLCAPALAAKTKSIKRVHIKTQQGKQVGLYEGSYALVIGVSDYTAGWPDLESVPRETAQLKSALEANGFKVTRVLNPDAARLKMAIENFITTHGIRLNNRLLIFFSGHGYTRDDGRRGYLVAADAPLPHQNLPGFKNKSISMNQVLTWARDIESKHALFLFDSCFSGTVFKAKDIPVPRHISAKTARPVRQFISAGSAGEKVPARSVFTPLFIDAISGEGDRNRDGYVTGNELGDFLLEKVTRFSQGQTPQYGTIHDYHLSRGDFVFQVHSIEEPAIGTITEDHLTNSVGMRFQLIPAGSFLMGSPNGKNDEKPVHRVKISRPFFMGTTEVTQTQWKSVMGNNPSHFKGPNHPVEMVSWLDIQSFIKKLNELEKKDHYRLPSEAEWEYACRAGTTTEFYSGNNESTLNAHAWYTSNSANQTQPVGKKKPNPWGLFDMHGNVWEWCGDWYGKGYYSDSIDNDPKGPSMGTNRVLRGGSWLYSGDHLRSSFRAARAPQSRTYNSGFRLLRTIASEKNL